MPGSQVKDWDLYHALRRKGHSKESAARIANSKKVAKGQPDMDDVHTDVVLGTKERKKRKRKKKLLADLKKHYGPGAHESGSEQTSHGRGRGGGGKKGGGSGRKSGPQGSSTPQAEQPGQNLRDLHDDEGGHKPFASGSEVKRPLDVEGRRPKTFENFDGQEFMRKRMQVAVEFAKQKGTQLRHHLFAGPTGLGKTTMAKIVASEMGANLKMVNAPKLDSVDGITSLLTGLEDGDVLFIDEIHALSPAMQDVLLPAMESGEIDIDMGLGMTRRLELADFTLLGATTDPDQLNNALKNRFQTETFSALNPDEIGNIVSRNAELLGLQMDAGAVAELSGRAQGVPRNAISHLDTVHRYNTVIEGGGPITADVVDGAMRMEQVDSAGLDFRQRAYLNTLDLSTRAGMGTGAISRSISQNTKTVSADVEPYLVASKFIQETAQGKAITPKGRKHLADLKAEGAAEFLDFITKRLFPFHFDLKKHRGPSAHESGSEQSAHGGGGGKGKGSAPDTGQSLSGLASTSDTEAQNEADEKKEVRTQIDDNPEIIELAKGRRSTALGLEETTSPMMEDVAGETGGEQHGLEYRVKTERSLRKKIHKDAFEKQITVAEAAAGINDTNRYTITWPPDESYVPNIDRAIEMFADKGWGVFDSKDKNGFAPGDHYGGINVNLTNGQGNIMEVQFHTPGSVELKAESHPLMKEHEELRLNVVEGSGQMALGGVKNAPRLREVENEVTEIWNGSLDYIPPGVEDWGTPTVFTLGKQIASDFMRKLDYWVRSDDGETIDVVYAVDPETNEVVHWNWADSEYVTADVSIMEIFGLGGSADYTRISDKLAIEMTRGEQGAPLPVDEAPGEAFSAEVKVEKADDYKNLVFGWASVAFTPDGKQILDKQGHAIDVEDLEDTAYDFSINSRGTGDMHKSEGFGQLVESMVLTNEKAELMGIPPGTTPQGWWVGFKVPPEYHESVRSGERTMFSIEGTARLEPLES